MRYFIVDDDKASRAMLKNIITECDLGVVIGEAKSGAECLSSILAVHPDVVLIDLLMPGLDGIEAIEQLRMKGFQGQFIMISQIVNKEMVGEAYEKGVEFFIHKPINRIEVRSILKRVAEQFQLRNSLLVIKESLGQSESATTRQQSVKEIVLSILNDMGIIGESGSDDIISMMEILIYENEGVIQLPPLKNLYESIAVKPGNHNLSSKAIEQRIRRIILTAVNNLASLGSIDYTNPVFEYYAPRYFDFQVVRDQMISIQEDHNEPKKAKVNIKKFLQALYHDTIEKYNDK
ncbi:response regulator [Siminovitchia fortis]|uniref:response regulator n=1 Tax=Siminovitchia fortis TaxID=254758 RepID=UPI00119E2EA0|nr:response regulator [Siminovitchia fortis]